MLKEAIILAGGFGTRLQSVVSDVPKPMAPVNGEPFLNYVFDYLKHYNIQHVVLSTGYLSDKIINYYQESFKGIHISYTTEESPLGTGGGLRLAMEKCLENEVLVMNGDSFFDISLSDFYLQHKRAHSDCSLALRTVSNASRYGTITLNESGQITTFQEKNNISSAGLINAGIYLIRKPVFMNQTPREVPFSIEKDFFEKHLNDLKLFGFEYTGYFMDIGIPEDYTQIQHDFKKFTYR